MDDLYPNDGSTFFIAKEPQDQIIERKKERAKVLEELKGIEETIEHLDKRIAFRDSIDSITIDLEKDPKAHATAMYVNKVVKVELELERRLLQEKLDMYKKS